MPAAPPLELQPAREEEELRAYLGSEFDIARLQQSQRELDHEFEGSDTEEGFYRSSNAYLYNLTAFAMTKTKLPYLEELTRAVPAGSRVLDYGCGIGSDGLVLLEAGYRVEFADFDNPSAAYLRWRLERRGLDAPVHDLDRHVPAGFDAAFAYDVIEHVSDPFEFLGEMERRARVVQVNLLEPGFDEQPLHHDLPMAELLRHVGRHRLLSYRVLYGGSHLVTYGSEEVGPLGRLAARAKLAGGRLRSRSATSSPSRTA